MAAVAKKSKKARKPGKFAQMSYYQLMSEAEKPQDERRKLPIGREGNVKVRRYHIVSEDLERFDTLAKAGDKFPNPFTHGSYHYSVEALKKLGINRWHKLSGVQDQMKELMSDSSTQVEDPETGKKTNAWQRFRDKESRNEKTGLDVDGRVLQNLQVLQRIGGKNPYGFKINQIAQDVLGLKGASLDLDRRGDEIMVKLNLEPENFVSFQTDDGKPLKVAVPFNGLRRRRAKGEAAEDGQEPKVVKVKASHPKKAKAKKAPKAKPEPETVTATAGDTAPEAESTQTPADPTPATA